MLQSINQQDIVNPVAPGTGDYIICYSKSGTAYIVPVSYLAGEGVATVTGNIVDNADPKNPVITQVQSDWNAVGGLGVVLNKPNLALYLLASGATTGAASQAQTFTNGINAGTIGETAPGGGVTADGILLKDGFIQTGDPSTPGTAGQIKLGKIIGPVVASLDGTQYIEATVDGTPVKIALVTV